MISADIIKTNSGWPLTNNLSQDAAMTTMAANPREPEHEIVTGDSNVLEWETSDERMKVTSKIPDSISSLLTGDWKCEPDDSIKPDIEEAASHCSPSALEKVEKDIEKAPDKCLRRLRVPRTRLVPIIMQLAEIYPKSSIQMSGFFLYPEGGGYMGWHTNSDSPCTRVYITHVKEGGKSFFRYRLDGKYVTSWDKAGWNLRQFEVTKENHMWHCVYAEEHRLSVGFRINRNLL